MASTFAMVMSACLWHGFADLRQLDPEPVDVSVGLNDTAMFECMAEGLPTPQVRWFKSSWLLQPSSNVRIYPTGTLEISLVQPGDVNTYYCEVQSSERLRRSQRVRLILQELSKEKVFLLCKRVVISGLIMVTGQMELLAEVSKLELLRSEFIFKTG